MKWSTQFYFILDECEDGLNGMMAGTGLSELSLLLLSSLDIGETEAKTTSDDGMISPFRFYSFKHSDCKNRGSFCHSFQSPFYTGRYDLEESLERCFFIDRIDCVLSDSPASFAASLT